MTSSYPGSWPKWQSNKYSLITNKSVTGAGTFDSNDDGVFGGFGDVTLDTGVTSNYYIERDSAYSKYNHLQVVGGELAMATWADANNGYQWVTLRFPQDATGPVYFTIKDIDQSNGGTRDGSSSLSYRTSGAQNYRDAVKVLNSTSPTGTAVAQPAWVSGGVATQQAVNGTTGWVQATTTTGGKAVYEVADPSLGITILLSNSYGTVSGNRNQVVMITGLQCGPAPAGPTPRYHFEGFGYSYMSRANGYECTNAEYGVDYRTLSNFYFNNFSGSPPRTGVPYGFAIVNGTYSDGSGSSPVTSATITQPVQLHLSYPAGMMAAGGTTEVFAFKDGTENNWELTSIQRNVSMVDGAGASHPYDTFTFTWKGPFTQNTVADVSSPTSWANTKLSGDWVYNKDYCAFPNMWGRVQYTSGGYTTANGFSGQFTDVNDKGGWYTF